MENAPSTQACREQNIQAIVDYISEGADAKSTRVGIELEHLVLYGDGGARVPYSGEDGIESLLERMSAEWPEKTFEGDHLIGVARTIEGIRETVTLEPGAQVELSAGPFNDLFTALEVLNDFEDELKSLLEPQGQLAVLMGYTPIERARDLELIPKKRYEFMDKHFSETGESGVRMMRGSASTQVSIDFADAKEAVRKLRLATAASPLLSLMCDNTVMYESELREHYLVRTDMWNDVDAARCGIVPGVFDEGYTLADYAAYILDTPAVVAPDGQGGWLHDERSFGEIYADTPMTVADVEHALSMVFPDVRLKKYVELRAMDALPPKYAAALAALVKGCFYSDAALDDMEKLFEGVTERDVMLAKMACMADGYEAEVYGRKAWKIAEQMNIIAKLNLTKEEREILEPLTTYVFSHVTLAEMTVFE